MSHQQDILAAADRCVMCGMCTPHCPTYQLYGTENESPRGRVSLIQGLYRQQLEMSPTLQAHLDHCLGCRACESRCPSGVRFASLMDDVRQDYPTHSWRLRLLLALFAQPKRIQATGRWLRRYRASGLPAVLAALGYLALPGLRRLHRLLPSLSRYSMGGGVYPAHHSQPIRGTVRLFNGCADSLFDQATKQAAITVLNRFGYVVEFAPNGGCCGALHQHNGDKERAIILANHQLDQLRRHPERPLLHTSSACASQMHDYPQLIGDDASEPVQQVADIGAFLQQQPWPAGLTLRPLAARVAVHEPCLQRNALQQGDWPYALLAHIPAIQLEPLDDNATCCGAAGSYMLIQAEDAERLAARKYRAIATQRPDIIVSSNIGCALQLRASLYDNHQEIEVLHPISLLARQLGQA